MASTSSASAGFTLIELLVVVSITVFLMLTVSAFFLTFIVGNTKAIFEQKLKRDGEQALTVMSQMLRNSHGLTSTCTTNLSSISFLGEDDLQTTLRGVNGQIASTSASTNPATNFYLTSDFSQLDPSNAIAFNCYNTNNETYVEINFTLKRGTNIANDQNTLTRQFKTGVSLRN